MALTVIPPPPPFLIFSLLLLFFPILSLSTANIPSFPVIHSPNNGGNLTGPASAPSCRLELSAELFGGVSSACSSSSSPLDRSRCCPVLAAWLFAAHARAALQPSSSAVNDDQDQDLLPISPDDSQRCVDSLQSSLAAKKIHLPRPNDTCDTVICFCGIRLHQIGSLRCPAAFNLTASSSGNRTATPTAAVKELESNCRNSSYAGCTRCLNSLQKVKNSGRAQEKGTTTERAAKMFGRDCQLMSLTWLLAKNKTLYIPTVSAVLRAILYSPHPQSQPYTCSPDHENMPLAVDSLQFSRTSDSSSSSSGSSAFGSSAYYYDQLLLSLPFFFFFFFSFF